MTIRGRGRWWWINDWCDDEKFEYNNKLDLWLLLMQKKKIKHLNYFYLHKHQNDSPKKSKKNKKSMSIICLSKVWSILHVVRQAFFFSAQPLIIIKWVVKMFCINNYSNEWHKCAYTVSQGLHLLPIAWLVHVQTRVTSRKTANWGQKVVKCFWVYDHSIVCRRE